MVIEKVGFTLKIKDFLDLNIKEWKVTRVCLIHAQQILIMDLCLGYLSHKCSQWSSILLFTSHNHSKELICKIFALNIVLWFLLEIIQFNLTKIFLFYAREYMRSVHIVVGES